LRGYGQRDPLVEYKKESFDLFQEMMERIQDRVVKYLWRMEIVVEHEQQPRVQRTPPPKPKQQPMFFSSGQQEPQTVKRKEARDGGVSWPRSREFGPQRTIPRRRGNRSWFCRSSRRSSSACWMKSVRPSAPILWSSRLPRAFLSPQCNRS